MKCIFLPIKTTPSVQIETQHSNVICSISFSQKNELDPTVKVLFKDLKNLEEIEIIQDIIEKTIVKKCSVSQVCVNFNEIKQGQDIFSLYINSFFLVAKIAKLETKFSLCSSTFVENDYSATITYCCDNQKIINLFTTGPFLDLQKTINVCITEAVAIHKKLVDLCTDNIKSATVLNYRN